MRPVLFIITYNYVIYADSDTPEGARSFNLSGVMPLGEPSIFLLGFLTSQRPQ